MQPKRDSSELEAHVAEYILVHTMFIYLHACMHVYGFKTRTNFDAATSTSSRFIYASISNGMCVLIPSLLLISEQEEYYTT